MVPHLAGPNPKVIQHVRELSNRIVRGKAAARNPSVRLHLALRITSIVLSTLGGAGIITEAPGNLAIQTGWAFWGSAILLVFGILSQIANEFQIAQRGLDSRTLSELCGTYDTRLEDMVIDDDPSSAAKALFEEIKDLFSKERYNRVLPRMTAEMMEEAAQKANTLINQNQGHWQPAQPQQGVVPTPAPPLAKPPAPLVPGLEPNPEP